MRRADAPDITVRVRIDGRADVREVRFPTWQPGASAMVGYFADGPCRYALKVLKVADVRAGAAGASPIGEPAYLRLLRRVALPESPFAPTRAMRSRIAGFHDSCETWLRDVDRDRARAALRRCLTDLPERRIEALLGELFDGLPTLHLSPGVSCLVDVSFPDLGAADVPAILQQEVGGTGPYRQRLLGRHVPTPGSPGRRRQLAFLVLLSVAGWLAETRRLGLDMSFRVDRRRTALLFPNVLVPETAPHLAYIDYFGLATPDGNLAERTGFWLGYGGNGLGHRFVAWLGRHLSERTSP
ncbi:hypothetical protein ABGB07_05610 [Micromonosporaceae bacterium B7E4]